MLGEGEIEALDIEEGAPLIIWHAHLGYPNLKYLQTLENKKVIHVPNWLTKDTFSYKFPSW